MARQHPPGPRNILAPFSLTYRHLIQMWRRPLEFVTELHRKYGPVAFFRVFGVRLYSVNDGELIHDVLVQQKTKFRKTERHMRTIRQMVGNGILTSDGDFWLRQRRMLQKAFSPQKLEGYADGMVEQTEMLLDGWDAKGNDAKVDITLEMTRLTLGIATAPSLENSRANEPKYLPEPTRGFPKRSLVRCWRSSVSPTGCHCPRRKRNGTR